MKPAERRLVEFVIWELRRGDLPADVSEAALSLAAEYPRPKPLRRLTEGPLAIVGFPRDEDRSMERRNCWPHQTGPIVQEMLDQGCTYVLVQDLLGEDTE